MPELPEVQIICNQLREVLISKTFSEIQFSGSRTLKSPPEEIRKSLLNQRIKNIFRNGKYLGIQAENLSVLWFHLGMTGQILISNQILNRSPYLQCLISFKEMSHSLVFYDIRKFGKIFLSNGTLPGAIQRLGPDMLRVSKNEFVALFKKRKGRIKSLLMNQQIVAGLGNIYADESLYKSGIHPQKRSYRLATQRLERLYESVLQVIQKAIRLGGSSIDDYKHVNGESGKFQQHHQVYAQTGKPCRCCGKGIRRVMIAGRSSHYCPICQK